MPLPGSPSTDQRTADSRSLVVKHALVVFVAAGCLASRLPAQVAMDSAAKASQPATPQRATQPVAPDTTKLGSLSQVVSFRDGRPVARATVIAKPAGARPSDKTRTTATNARGFFRLDSLAHGPYDVQVVYTAGSITRRIIVDGPVLGGIVVPADSLQRSSLPSRIWTIVALVFFLTSLVFTKWHNIAKSLHAILREQLATLSIRLRTETGSSDEKQIAALRETVERLQAEMEVSWKKFKIFEFFFWSRGRENATWIAVHEVERQLAAFLAPPEQVETYLRWAEAELRVIRKPAALAIANAIVESLKTCEESERPLREKTHKALLGRALAVINADRDTSFATLMEWQNKASWLIVTALVIIAFLSAAVGNAVLFLAGAAGGYLGRLMRALRREDLPLDYGASWTTLFLSPLFGALTGWFGVALISLLSEPELGLLGPAFLLVRWDDALGPATLSVAFLLGFSERFFDAIVGAVERHARKDEAGQKTELGAGGAPAVTGRDTSAASGSGQSQSSGGGATADGTASIRPVITTVERQQRSTGALEDALVITGHGFTAAGTVKVNGEVRPARVQSAGAITLPLNESDVQRIDIGGDFEIEITNPGGAVSNRFDYV